MVASMNDSIAQVMKPVVIAAEKVVSGGLNWLRNQRERNNSQRPLVITEVLVVAEDRIEADESATDNADNHFETYADIKPDDYGKTVKDIKPGIDSESVETAKKLVNSLLSKSARTKLVNKFGRIEDVRIRQNVDSRKAVSARIVNVWQDEANRRELVFYVTKGGAERFGYAFYYDKSPEMAEISMIEIDTIQSSPEETLLQIAINIKEMIREASNPQGSVA